MGLVQLRQPETWVFHLHCRGEEGRHPYDLGIVIESGFDELFRLGVDADIVNREAG